MKDEEELEEKISAWKRANKKWLRHKKKQKRQRRKWKITLDRESVQRSETKFSSNGRWGFEK